MSILVLMDRFLPDNGGSINWMVNTYSRWSQEKIVFVVPQCSGSQNVDSQLPFTVFRVPMEFMSWDPTRPNMLIEYVRLASSIQKICQKFQVRQIHCAKVLPEGLVARWIQWRKNIPYLLYAHGEEVLFTQTSRKFEWLVPRLYNSASAIISNSSHTQDRLIRIGVKAQHIHIVHPGVDVQKIPSSADDHNSIRRRFELIQSIILLTVGRLQRRKGQDMVIRALPQILKEFPSVKYLIVGEGEELGLLQQLADEVGVRKNVVFAKSVEAQDLWSIYAACDIFVMPNRQIGSDIEGFGMVFLEASAAGKPVVGGMSGGTSESILDGITGIRVNGESSDEIAKAILRLLSAPDTAKQMGHQGREWVQENCSWETVVGKTQQVVSAMK